jgi:hypothetical protein
MRPRGAKWSTQKVRLSILAVSGVTIPTANTYERPRPWNRSRARPSAPLVSALSATPDSRLPSKQAHLWNQRGGFFELSMWVDPTNRTDSFHTSLAAGPKLPAGWKLPKKKTLIPTTHNRLRFGNQFALFARVSQSTRQTI